MLRELGSIAAALGGWLALWVAYNDLLVQAGLLPPYILAPLQGPVLAALCTGAILSVFGAVCVAVRLMGERSYAAGAALALLPASFVYLQYELSLPPLLLWLSVSAMVVVSIVGCRLQWNGRPELVWITAEAPGD